MVNGQWLMVNGAAVLVDRGTLGMLHITGKTRLELIDRMSTQAVKGLKSGEGAATVMTTEIGRIIDRLILYATSDSVYVLTGENHAGRLARYLMGHVFFNDDFQVKELTADTALFGVYGPQAAEKMSAAGFPEVDLPLHHWRQATVGGVTAYLHRTDPIAGEGYFVMSRAAEKEALQQHLLDTGIMPVDEATFDYLRIEAGLPRFGRELTLDYIPLEANLWPDVSFTKGCYTGQEIIARMESRGRLAKRLVRLRAAEPVAAGTPVMANGKEVGSITSAAVGLEETVALGYIKTGVLETPEPPLTADEVALSITLIAPDG
jgi:aminomethyltransferase